MAGQSRMTSEEVVRQVLGDEHADVIHESVRAVTQEMMEAEVSELIGATHGERTEDRATHRNGYRPRRWDTRAGEVELQIPSSVRAATSRASCSPGNARSRHSSPSFSRLMSAGSRPGGSISSSRALACASARARSAGSRDSLDEARGRLREAVSVYRRQAPAKYGGRCGPAPHARRRAALAVTAPGC